FAHRREGQGGGARAKALLAALRVGAVALLLLVLFQPVTLSKVFAVNKSSVGVLIDESLSMDRAEEYPDDLKRELAEAAGLSDPSQVNQLSRGELVQRVLKREGVDLIGELGKRVDPHLYAFSTTTRSISGAGHV